MVIWYWTYGKGPFKLLPLHGLLFLISSKVGFFSYAPSHREDSTYHSLWYSHVALAGTRNSLMGPPWGIDPTTPHTMSKCSTTVTFTPLLKRRKEGNVLFNDALNTFYLRIYGVVHMVKDHSDSERGKPLPSHGLFFQISTKGSFICIIPQTG